MAEQDSRREMAVECRTCHAQLRFTVVHVLYFPSDARLVLDLLRARINMVSCPVCATTVSLQPPLIVMHEELGEILVARAGEELLEALEDTTRDAEVSVRAVTDYNDLLSGVWTWADAYFNRALAPTFGGGAPERAKDGTELLHTPLTLLLLHAQSEGLLEPRLITEPQVDAERQREILGTLLAAAVVDRVDRLFTYAFHHGGAQTVLDRVHDAIPSECLTASALVRLTERCVDWDDELLKDPPAVDRAWRCEYLNAVAHAAAGVRNPRGSEWANAHLLLFSLSRLPHVSIPEEMLLDADVLSRTLRFDEAWDVSRGTVGRADESRLELVGEWFVHIGLADRYEEELKAAPVRVDLRKWADEDDTTIARSILEVVHAAVAERGTPELASSAIVSQCRILLRSGRRGAAEQLAAAQLEHLAASSEIEELGWTLKSLAEVFNGALAYGATRTLLAEHAGIVLDADAAPPCRLHYSLLNEVGNAHRYANRPADALETYDATAEVMDVCPESDDADRATLDRNRALVLRELGYFDEAVRTLSRQLQEAAPDSVQTADLRLNLARTFADVNLPEEAVVHARAAAAVPLSPAHAAQRVLILIALAAIRVAAEDTPELPEYEEALALATTMDELRWLVAASVLHYASRASVAPEVLVAAEGIARERLETAGDAADSIYVSLATGLAEWKFEQGERDEATRITSGIRDLVDDLDALPWQMLWLMARMADPGETAERWPLMRAALNRIEAAVPVDAGPQFGAPWLSDKEPFQALLVTVAQAALREGHATPLDALDVCEFTTGREVRPRGGQAVSAPPEERFAEVAPPGRLAVAVAFLEGEDRVDLVLVPSSGDHGIVVPLPMPLDEVRAARAEFDVRIGSRALLPDHHRAAAAAVAGVLDNIGSLLAAHLDEGTHVCFLPSATLLGLPLHAATAGGRLLLERNPISYAPNLSMLCELLAAGPVPAPGTGAAGVIAVPKDGDRPEFVVRTYAAADRLGALLSHGGALAVNLRETAADKPACLGAFEHVDHLVLLLHGAEGGRIQGRGLCVSDGEVLPRAPLPVDSAPQLRRFLLDAEDLDPLPRTPAAVVSLACSSGRTLPGAGGSRIGLDRALLPNGTRALVAPLWDVDQESALDQLEDFHRRWVDDPATGPGQHLRAAQLAARERYDELYHWAPFMLKGSWN